jgi:hypothetical protein
MCSVNLNPVELKEYRARSFGVESCGVTVYSAVFLGLVELDPVGLQTDVVYLG